MNELKQKLERLAPGEIIKLPLGAYVQLLAAHSNEGWVQSRTLAVEHDCDVEFRPEGMVCFIRR